MATTESYSGLLCIGDPHLCGRVPGFRRDDYPHVILAKLRWALRYADEQSLLPCILGDLFHYPRDNANWLLVELMDLFDGRALTVAGNHDCGENTLNCDDTLSILLAAGKLRSLEIPWRGRLGSAPAVVGGTHWGQKLPAEFTDPDQPRWVFWITHHDVRFPGYEEGGHFNCREIPGVDLVVNGHIHRHLPDVTAGRTLWCNPGNIARVNRSDITRQHEPGVLRIDVTENGWTKTRMAVPHESFESVFQSDMVQAGAQSAPSAFIDGLAALQRHKTDDGQGLKEFLEKNLSRFDPPVAAEINRLATEVLGHAR
jgi:predicted phosphodiesterase